MKHTYEERREAYNLSIDWFARRTDDARYLAGACAAATVFVWQISKKTNLIEAALACSALALLLSAISYALRWDQESNARDLHIRVSAGLAENDDARLLARINKTETLGRWLGHLATAALTVSVIVLAFERLSQISDC